MINTNCGTCPFAHQVLRTVRNFSYLAKAKKAEQEEEKPAGIDCSGLIRD